MNNQETHDQLHGRVGSQRNQGFFSMKVFLLTFALKSSHDGYLHWNPHFQPQIVLYLNQSGAIDEGWNLCDRLGD